MVPRLRLRLKTLYSSQFVRDAVALLVLNTTARGIAFFGVAYAVRCLGPLKLGTSALVQTTSQQVALVYNGGFDIAAVRKIARDKDNAHLTTATVLSFRLSMALIVSAIWAVLCLILVSPANVPVWMLGVPLMLTGAGTLTFAFQGLEKLPIQNAITAGSALLTAVSYFVFFKPGVFLGADLVVTASLGAMACAFSWYVYHSIFGKWPLIRVRWADLLPLLQESRHYWALAIVIYFYSVFQIPLIARLVGPHDAGIFRSAFLLAGGLELLFNSVNSVLLPRLVAWSKSGVSALWRQQLRLLAIYLALGLPLVAVLFTTAPVVYRLVLGRDFIEGVGVFQVLIFGRLTVFVGQIYAWGLAAIGRDRQFLSATAIGALLSITLNLILIPRYGTIGAAYVSVGCELFIHAYCFCSFRNAVVAEKMT